jgi:hypothetical protein
MAGIEPAIHANTGQVEFAWMLGSSPSMTEGWVGTGRKRRRKDTHFVVMAGPKPRLRLGPNLADRSYCASVVGGSSLIEGSKV